MTRKSRASLIVSSQKEEGTFLLANFQKVCSDFLIAAHKLYEILRVDEKPILST